MSLTYVGAFVILGSETATVSYDETSGIGYSINVITSNSPSDVNLGSPILDYDYLNEINLLKMSNSYSHNSENFFGDIESMYGFVTNEYSSMINAYGVASGFFGAIELSFNGSTQTHFSNSYNQFYAAKKYVSGEYSLALPNYSSFLYYYENNINEGYYDALYDLYHSNNPDFYDFFETYGTHLIAQATYGCRLDAFYYVTSNEKYFDTSITNEMEIKFDTIFNNFASGGDLSIGENTFTSLSGYLCEYGWDISTYGGASNYSFSLENGTGGNFYNWSSSLDEDNAALIGFENGLIPLWEILPSDFSSMSSDMEQAFDDYAREKCTEFLDNYSYGSVVLLDGHSSQVRPFRYEGESSDIYTITDESEFNQSYDELYFDSDFDIELARFKAQGFQTIDIEVELEIAEIDDGYQQIYIYQNSNTSTTNNQKIAEIEVEHCPGFAGGSYISHEFVFEDLPINSFDNESFVIRYGARGNSSDDWMNKVLKVKIILHK